MASVAVFLRLLGHTDVVRHFAILSISWSLAVELQAYAILPLIIQSLRTRWIVGMSSLLVLVLMRKIER